MSKEDDQVRQNKQADNLYTIEQKAQKLFSSDEASLLEEMDHAERIWAEEKIRDPNAISSMETAAVNHYKKLAEQIRIRGIKPVTEEEYERRRKNDLGEDEDLKSGIKKIGWKKFVNKKKWLLMSVLYTLLAVKAAGTPKEERGRCQNEVFLNKKNFDLE